MFKRSIAILVTALMCASALTGCGNTDEGQTSGNTASDNTVNAGNAKTSGNTGKTVLRIMSMQQAENPEGPLETEIAEEWLAKHPDVEIEWISVSANDMTKKLSAMATGGGLPDIITTPTEMLASAKDMGFLVDLNEVFPKEFLEDFYPEVLTQTTIDGELLMLPYQGMNAALLYRSDWLEETGLEVPTNWEEFREVAKAMTKDTDNDGTIDRYGFAMMGTRNASAESRFLYITRSFGVRELYQEVDGTWKTDIGNDDFKKALETFCDFALKDGVVNPGVLETGYGEAANLIVTEKAGMIITGSNAVGTILTQNPELEGKLASCLIPAGIQIVSDPREAGYSISTDCKNKELAADYIMFVCSDDNLAKWTEKCGRIPTKKSASDDPALQTPELAGFAAGTAYFYERPKHSGYVEVQDVLGEAYQSVLAGNATVEQASETAREKVEEIIQSYE